MEAVFDYHIPLLHPLAVHFPISLLLVACLTALGWAVRGTAYWFAATWLLLTTGFMGALFAYFTGDDAYEQSEGTPMVDLLSEVHGQAAIYATVMIGITWLVFSAVGLWRRQHVEPLGPGVRWGLGVLVLVCGILIAWTSHIGGTMVWGVPR